MHNINIAGVGEKTKEALARLNICRSLDLLFHFPANIVNKQFDAPIYMLRAGDLATLYLRVIDIDQPNNPNLSRKRQFKIYCSNNTGRINLVYFNYYPQYLMKWLKVGSEIIATGKIDLFNDFRQISHPEVISAAKSIDSIKKNEIVYPLTYGITSKQIHKYINEVISKLSINQEWIDEDILKKFNWLSFTESLQKIHNPSELGEISPYSQSRQRIAYDELLASQLMVHLLRNSREQKKGRAIIASGSLREEFLSKLPFSLTNSQRKSIDEITSDQALNKKMSRLLQGDVGSGKTIVAFAAIFNAVESGAQAVLMVPTDILANQHFTTLEKFASSLPIKFALLTGKTKPKDRQQILKDLDQGEINILVGTHAVFQEKVNFNDLGLVVIDEQHRFGVEQRVALVNKGNNADLLIMSATPIPRSLSLIFYGDMDISKIDEKPKTRIAIKTSVMPSSKLGEIIASLDKVLKNSGKIYWICPLVSESEDSDLEKQKTASETRMQALAKVYPGIVGLVHGQLDANSKQEMLNKFTKGDIKILVATTVIEVGVDVPDATVIIIENAESFGLAGLHQLRGRVGRGDKQSHCILLYNNPIGKVSWERLKAIRDNDDGFVLAEMDLKLRGGGDIIGTRQSGLPDFKAVDFVAHHHLIAIANIQAQKILREDPTLIANFNQKYHHLLSIFGFNYKNLELILN